MAKGISCLLTKGITKKDACGYSLKQITDIYIANYEEVTAGVAPDTVFGEDGYTVSGITTSGKWYHFEPAKDTAAYNDDLTVGGNGSKYRKHSVTFAINGAYQGEMAKTLDTLSLGRFVIVLKLSDGTGIMLGRLTGLEASAASSLSEAAADGQNGINFTMEANTTEPALPLSAEALKTVVESEAQV